jgi:hypothetical protein
LDGLRPALQRREGLRAPAGRPRRARGDDDSEGGADESDESDTNDSFVTSDEEEGEGGGSGSESGGTGSDEDPTDRDDWYLRRLASGDPCAGADEEEVDDVDMEDAPFSSNPFVDDAASEMLCDSCDEQVDALPLAPPDDTGRA